MMGEARLAPLVIYILLYFDLFSVIFSMFCFCLAECWSLLHGFMEFNYLIIFALFWLLAKQILRVVVALCVASQSIKVILSQTFKDAITILRLKKKKKRGIQVIVISPGEIHRKYFECKIPFPFKHTNKSIIVNNNSSSSSSSSSKDNQPTWPETALSAVG